MTRSVTNPVIGVIIVGVLLIAYVITRPIHTYVPTKVPPIPIPEPGKVNTGDFLQDIPRLPEYDGKYKTDISLVSECMQKTELDSNKVVLRLGMECLHAKVGDTIRAAFAKYEILLSLLEVGASVFVYTDDVRLLVPDPTPWMVGDTDLEIRSFACHFENKGDQWYQMGASLAQQDTYNGWWFIQQRNNFYCNVPWYFVDAGYDPQIFYIRPTEAAKYWVNEMLQHIGTVMLTERVSLKEEFLESELFNNLLVYRSDKYLNLRKFPSSWVYSDNCSPDIHTSTEALARIRSPSFKKSSSVEWDKHFTPIQSVSPPPKIPVPPVVLCGKRGDNDTLCTIAETAQVMVNDQPSVGLTILKGNFLRTDELGTLPRADVAKHTICCCLDAAACDGCTTMGMHPYKLEEKLIVPGATGKGLINIYKYYITYELVQRGFGVLSYDLDIIILRNPWEYFSDLRFDFYGSTDAHTPAYQTTALHWDLYAHLRSSINTGFWYVRPSPGGRNFFHRVTSFFDASQKHQTAFFFEQAMVATTMFQLRIAGKQIAAGDVKWKLLSPVLFMNSKNTVQFEGDPLALCNAVMVHSNYGCPWITIHKSTKGGYLQHVAAVCQRHDR